MNEVIEVRTADLKIDPAVAKTVARYSRVVAMANATIIETPDDAERVGSAIRDLRERKAEIEGSQTFLLDPLKDAVARVRAFFSPALSAIEAADGIYRKKLGAWNEAEAEKARAARAEADRIERDRKAAAEREAAEIRRAAEQQALLVDVHEAQAIRENAESAAISRELEAGASQVVVTAAAKASGTGGRDNHNAEPIDDEATAVRLIVDAIKVGRTELLGLLALDPKAIRAKAKAEKTHFNVPGLRYTNNRSIVVRG